MSTIPFVARLGDAIEAATAAVPAHDGTERRGQTGGRGAGGQLPRARRRRAAYVVAGALLLGGTAAAAGVLSIDHEQSSRAPANSARFGPLEDAMLRLEAAVDCLPPADFAARAQRLLEQRGWRGWTATLDDGSRGPCGAGTRPAGAGRELVFVAETREVVIFAGFARSTGDALWGPGNLVSQLDARAASGCRTGGELAAFARRRFAAAGLRALPEVAPMRARRRVGGASGARYANGCAIVSGVAPDPDPRAVVVRILERP